MSIKFIARIGWALLLPLAGAEAATLTGHVVGVHDGDTITVLDASETQHKIRFAGIDAPELKQAFGTRSRQNLAAWYSARTFPSNGKSAIAISAS